MTFWLVSPCHSIFFLKAICISVFDHFLLIGSHWPLRVLILVAETTFLVTTDLTQSLWMNVRSLKSSAVIYGILFYFFLLRFLFGLGLNLAPADSYWIKELTTFFGMLHWKKRSFKKYFLQCQRHVADGSAVKRSMASIRRQVHQQRGLLRRHRGGRRHHRQVWVHRLGRNPWIRESCSVLLLSWLHTM